MPLLRKFLLYVVRRLVAQLRHFKGFYQAAREMLIIPSDFSLTMFLIGIG